MEAVTKIGKIRSNNEKNKAAFTMANLIKSLNDGSESFHSSQNSTFN